MYVMYVFIGIYALSISLISLWIITHINIKVYYLHIKRKNSTNLLIH